MKKEVNHNIITNHYNLKVPLLVKIFTQKIETSSPTWCDIFEGVSLHISKQVPCDTILSQKFQHPTMHKKSHTMSEHLMFLISNNRATGKRISPSNFWTVNLYGDSSSYQPNIPFIAGQKSKTVQMIITIKLPISPTILIRQWIISRFHESRTS